MVNYMEAGISYGDAIEAMKKGSKVARASWLEGASLRKLRDFMVLSLDERVPWIASQDDTFSNDWSII